MAIPDAAYADRLAAQIIGNRGIDEDAVLYRRQHVRSRRREQRPHRIHYLQLA